MMPILRNAIMTGVSYLSSNRVPPNTPPERHKKLRSTNHLESKKFYIVLTSVIILAFFYFSSVGILFFIPHVPELISGFVTIFSKTIEILAIIIASYVGAQAAIDLKYGSSSSASLSGTTNTETIKQEITVIHTNAKEDDYELK